jgi:hypothetical protein
MKLVLDLLQAAGVGAAIGIRPFLPALLVGALAAANAGVDYDGTGWSFLEKPPFLIALLVALVAFDLVRRRAGDDRLERGAGLIAIAVVAVVVAALEGAGTLADHHESVIAGLLLAAAGAGLGLYATRPVFARARARLDAAAASVLPLYREGVALVAAAACVLLPPLAIVVVGGLAWLAAGGRRRDGEKYAGLRILR